MLSKFSKLVKTHQSDIVLALAIVLITVISFNLGKISVLNGGKKTPVEVIKGEDVNREASMGRAAISKTNLENQPVVVSKNSKGKLYHFSWCPGASQIAEKNKITFPNEATAVAAGYTLAGNCRK